MEIQIQTIDPAQAREIPTAGFGFANIPTDHMLTRQYTPESGWQDPQIRPYAPIQIELSAAVFHYAQEVFEGTKAYRRPDGAINLFRIQENIRRFNRSAERMAMPTIDEEEHLECIVSLIEIDHAWVPAAPNTALYIRPTMIASEPTFGKLSASEFLYFLLLSPTDPYFPTGFDPIGVYVENEYVRAVRGGIGEAKTGGNYAASNQPTKKALAAGYKQILWLDALERRYVEEMGGMNICFVYGHQIVTPPLTGTILPGVTRDSIIHLGRDLGYEVEEALTDINDLMRDIKSGQVTEIFACGTAAVIAPIGRLGYKGQDVLVNNQQVGKVTRHLFDELTGIQYGRLPDRFGWTLKINPQR